MGRGKTIQIRVKLDEFSYLKRVAAAEDKTVSAYCREMLLGGGIAVTLERLEAIESRLAQVERVLALVTSTPNM